MELNSQRQKTVTVFGSGKPMEGDPFYKEASELGRELARAGFVLCNGGYGGIMEASARGAKEAGGRTIGITTKAFGCGANPWIDQEICEETHADRLAKLIELGDAYVILRGGTGTLLELATVWESRNKRLIAERPIVVLGDFWKSVIDLLYEVLRWEGLETSTPLTGSTRYVRVVETLEECMRIIKEELRVKDLRQTRRE
ncbi:MAG: LOG family protein [Bacteroidota bacterium]